MGRVNKSAQSLSWSGKLYSHCVSASCPGVSGPPSRGPFLRQSPARPHEEVEVTVIVDGAADAGVVREELLPRDDTVAVVRVVEGVQEAPEHCLQVPLTREVLRVALGVLVVRHFRGERHEYG